MKHFAVLFLAFLLFVTGAIAREPVRIFSSLFDQTIIESEPAFNYRVLAITRVIDGDTFEAWIHIAPRLAYFVDVRVEGVDTPEITGPRKEEGLRVKELVEKFLRSAKAITITFTGAITFNRWVCIVWVEGKNLSAWIEENGLTKATP